MIKYYARQVEEELQDSDFFYHYKDKNTGKYELGINDDVYCNEVVIYGNNDFLGIITKDFKRLLDFNNANYQYFECYFNKGYWKEFDNLTQAIEWYFPKDSGKKIYQTRNS